MRPDLKILVMSATLDEQAVSQLLGNAPTIVCEHRPHPVETRYVAPRAGDDLTSRMAKLVRRALEDEEGSILAFLPGEGEIRKTIDLLKDSPLPANVRLAPLYGAMPAGDQQGAIAPARNGERKVVIATTIAETSLTIEGVRVVLDCGYKRAPRFDPESGMTRLTTIRISQAAAEQRRGRAGRLGPGICYRMWAEPETRGLDAYDSPEIDQTDLAPLALDLAAWGICDPSTLSWSTPPPPGAYAQGLQLLHHLGAVDQSGHISTEGRAMVNFPLHPRLAHMVLRGVELNVGSQACDLAALLSDRDIFQRDRSPDMRSRLEALRGDHTATGTTVKRGAVARVRAIANQIRRTARVSDENYQPEQVGTLLALAYPDRIAQRRSAGRYRLSGGGGAFLDPADPLAANDFLAVADVGGVSGDARIFLAAPLSVADIEDAFADDIAEEERIEWDKRKEVVVCLRQRRLGALVLNEQPLNNPDPDFMLSALISGIQSIGIQALPWTPALRTLRARVALMRDTFPAGNWPDLSDHTLRETLVDWLGPYLSGVTRRSHLAQIDLNAALRGLLSWEQTRDLEEQAPTHIAVPSGSRVKVDYGADGGLALKVKLQEVFGMSDTPTVANGRAQITLHLLSPARRPLAVTQDLGSFWKTAYPDVRREMRGRYPRHIWPENPLDAAPTRRSVKSRNT